MLTVICDSCRKQVKNAMKDVNYVTLKDRAMCLPCKRAFDDKISNNMTSKRKYSFSDYRKVYSDTLTKICK